MYILRKYDNVWKFAFSKLSPYLFKSISFIASLDFSEISDTNSLVYFLEIIFLSNILI